MNLLFPMMYQLCVRLLPDQSEQSVLLQKQILKIYFALTQVSMGKREWNRMVLYPTFALFPNLYFILFTKSLFSKPVVSSVSSAPVTHCLEGCHVFIFLEESRSTFHVAIWFQAVNKDGQDVIAFFFLFAVVLTVFSFSRFLSNNYISDTMKCL
jgi:hypothetical protein